MAQKTTESKDKGRLFVAYIGKEKEERSIWLIRAE